jgi:hypothetical protein
MRAHDDCAALVALDDLDHHALRVAADDFAFPFDAGLFQQGFGGPQKIGPDCAAHVLDHARVVRQNHFVQRSAGSCTLASTNSIGMLH